MSEMEGPAGGEIGEAGEDSLQQELAALLNKHSQENDSGTPDFVLAEFLLSCLAAWNTGIVQRSAWYGEPVKQAGLSLPYDPPHGEPETVTGVEDDPETLK